MSRTVTALYDTKADAEAARERLSSAVDVEGRAKIIDQSSMGGDQGSSDFNSVPLSHEDRAAYGEGLRRGGFMLCAQVDEDEDADKIVSVLEQTSGVDLEERQTSWRNEGWSGSSDRQTTGQATFGSSQDRDTSFGSSTTGSTDGSNIIEEEHIPIIDEQLRVGKREVERGGALSAPMWKSVRFMKPSTCAKSMSTLRAGRSTSSSPAQTSTTTCCRIAPSKCAKLPKRP